MNENKIKLIKEIQDNKYIIYLQPKFNTKTETIVGAEALIRKIEDNKVIMPDKFIPKYEESGVITTLDMYVLEEVCKLQKRWKESGMKILPISINQSKHHLKNSDYANELKNIISKYNINPKFIELEMTETSVIEDINIAKKAGNELQKLGFNISMDDFGTGYSSFNVLKDIKIDILKIDKSFFDNILENKRAQIIIQSIIEMCKKLNIKTVAEGIETKQQIDFLKEVDCDIIQGYYFSKPISIQEFETKYMQIV